MPKKLNEVFVKRAVISWLSRQGYSRNLKEKELHEHGIDIKVRHNKYPRYFIVEVKGEPDAKKVKYPNSRREVDFIYVMGQIVTRMSYRAKYKYGIGLPESYSKKVIIRLSPILLKKLNLSVLLVNNQGKVREINWKKLNAVQKASEVE